MMLDQYRSCSNGDSSHLNSKYAAIETRCTLTTAQKRPLLDEHCSRPSKQARRGHIKPQCQVNSVLSTVAYATTQHVEISNEGTTSSVINAAGDNDEQREICYGMFVDPAVEVEVDRQRDLVPVHPDDSGQTLIEDNTNSHSRAVGILGKKTIQILGRLQREKDLSIQCLLKWVSGAGFQGTFSTGTPECLASSPHWSLFVNIYGPAGLSEDIGYFAEVCGICLQDPEYCDRNVEYLNPHRLPSEDGLVLYTQSLPVAEFIVNVEEPIENPFDLLTTAENNEALPETLPHFGLRTSLYRHQKQGLYFMLEREKGWALHDNRKDIWKAETSQTGLIRYINKVTGDRQFETPVDFRSGILADDPGLGKTLTVISLILSDLPNHHAPVGSTQYCSATGESVGPTLLIAPLSVLQVWSYQIQHHVAHGILRYHVYYGKDRNRSPMELKNLDLVITTYSVVSKEWERGESSRQGPGQLHSARWHRIVLDEAHTIRVHSTICARSVCALQAEKRWAVTGTPIQNRLSDLFSLFKFIRISPFDEHQTFRRHVTQSWKSRSDPVAVARLKVLVNSVTLRRTKGTISLPGRKDEICILNFDHDEAQLYQQIKAQTRQRIDELGDVLPGHKFLNALKWINDLRLICNHGMAFGGIRTQFCAITPLVEPISQPSTPYSGLGITDTPSPCQNSVPPDMARANIFSQTSSDDLRDSLDATPTSCHDPDLVMSDSPPTEEEWTDISANIAFADLVSSGLANCSACLKDLSDARHSIGLKDRVRMPHLSKSQLLCALCFIEKAIPSEKYFSVSLQSPTSMNVAQPMTPLTEVELATASTKIKALVSDLSCRPRGEKSVVFSHWTRTLDFIQKQLEVAGIQYGRLDGNMSSASRAGAVRSFQTNADIPVFLLSIACGGVGLDLTVANKAYIMEPQWNPMIEDQALDRIHRLGQTKDVTTVRYIIRGSFEENIRVIQKRKKDLVQLAFQEGPLKQEDLTYGRLQYLKDLVG